MSSRTYRIVVRGRLSDSFAAGFDGLSVEPGVGANGAHETALVGSFVDQSQLHGVLDHLRNLGVELVSVNVVG